MNGLIPSFIHLRWHYWETVENMEMGAEVMVQWFKTLVALAENL